MIAELGTVRLGFDDTGDGLPVIFLHGFPHDRSLWKNQVQALSLNVRCIPVDLRGFGESSTSGPWSIDRMADDIALLLDHLEIERAVVCGLSMGGYVTLAMWRRHADRVKGLVLCDTKAGADTDEGRTKRNALIALAEREGAAAVAALQLPGMVGQTTREQRQPVMHAVQAMMERVSVEGIVGALTAMRDRPDSRPLLPSIAVPTLILAGDEDVLTPPSEARAMLEALSERAAAQLEIIEGAGHVSCLERPAAVTHVLADFLAAVAAYS